MKDCVMMKDGKMMEMKDGKTMDLTNDMTLKNGTVVMANGTIRHKDGKTSMFKEGDCMMMDGTMTHMAHKKSTHSQGHKKPEEKMKTTS